MNYCVACHPSWDLQRQLKTVPPQPIEARLRENGLNL